MPKPHFIEYLESKARLRRFLIFVSVLASVDRPIKILDVGGTYEYWKTYDHTMLGDVEFVLLNVFPQNDVVPPFSSVVGDARDLSRYSDREFDVVFSNSVINFVGNICEQERMAKEIRRVGKRYFVQAPNHGFWVDWRTLVPFFHFLPVSFQAWCLRHFAVGSYARVETRAKSLYLAGRVRDLRRKELTLLFPGATIVPERICCFTKSFVVYRGFD